jgi:hypothetical protein
MPIDAIAQARSRGGNPSAGGVAMGRGDAATIVVFILSRHCWREAHIIAPFHNRRLARKYPVLFANIVPCG